MRRAACVIRSSAGTHPTYSSRAKRRACVTRAMLPKIVRPSSMLRALFTNTR